MPPPRAAAARSRRSAEVWWSLVPWIIVCAVLLVWGTGWFKALVNPIFTVNYPVEGLHNLVAEGAAGGRQAGARSRPSSPSPICPSPAPAC